MGTLLYVQIIRISQACKPSFSTLREWKSIRPVRASWGIRSTVRILVRKNQMSQNILLYLTMLPIFALWVQPTIEFIGAVRYTLGC